MTKKQSVILMNILAVLIGYINKFSLSYRLIHGLVGYESVWECVCKEMGLFLDKAPDIDSFLENLQDKANGVISSQNQRSVCLCETVYV